MSDLDYPFAQPPRTDGQLIEVAPGILWLRMPLPLALDHINLYLLRDTTGWIILDTGINTPATRQLWQHIFDKELRGETISGVVCTHYHFDHAGLAGWLTERWRVPLYMSYGEYYTLRTMATARGDEMAWEHLEHYQQAGFPAADLGNIRDVIRMSNMLISPPPAAFRRLRHGEQLHIGGRHWQLLLGEGHVAEHMLLYCAEDHLLLAGDQLLPRITSNIGVLPIEPEADLLAGWLDSLTRFAALPQETLVLPAHELPYYGLPQRIEQLRAHHAQMLDQLLTLCRATPLTAYQATLQLFPHRHDKMDDMMAMAECLAHLNYLRHRGQIERHLDSDGAWRYQPRTT